MQTVGAIYINIVIPQVVWSSHCVVNSTCVVYVLLSKLYCSFACLFLYATVLVSAFFCTLVQQALVNNVSLWVLTQVWKQCY